MEHRPGAWAFYNDMLYSRSHMVIQSTNIPWECHPDDKGTSVQLTGVDTTADL